LIVSRFRHLALRRRAPAVLTSHRARFIAARATFMHALHSARLRFSRPIFTLACAPVLAFALAHAPAQTPRPIEPQRATTNARPDEADDALAVETDLVNLHVRVTDSRSRPVADARREEFRVFEDNVEQEIKFFSREEVPINYGLVVGNTSRLRAHVGELIGAAKMIVESSRAGDEFFLARFERRAGGVQLKWDYTSDRAALFTLLDAMRDGGGRAALRDALYFSASYVAREDDGQPARKDDEQVARKDDEQSARTVARARVVAPSRNLRRRALIVLTDGDDRASRHTEDELFARLAAEGVQVYPVGFLDAPDESARVGDPQRRERARALLTRLAAETGGRAFFPASFAELPSVAQEIAVDLRTQYVVGYTPKNRARDGRFRTLRVTVSGGDGSRTALTRAGYFAPLAKK
jgi:Ca-activated chloride channel family protein